MTTSLCLKIVRYYFFIVYVGKGKILAFNSRLENYRSSASQSGDVWTKLIQHYVTLGPLPDTPSSCGQ